MNFIIDFGALLLFFGCLIWLLRGASNQKEHYLKEKKNIIDQLKNENNHSIDQQNNLVLLEKNEVDLFKKLLLKNIGYIILEYIETISFIGVIFFICYGWKLGTFFLMLCIIICFYKIKDILPLIKNYRNLKSTSLYKVNDNEEAYTLCNKVRNPIILKDNLFVLVKKSCEYYVTDDQLFINEK